MFLQQFSLLLWASKSSEITYLKWKKAQKWDFSWKFIDKWVGKLDIQMEKIWDPRDHRVMSNLTH